MTSAKPTAETAQAVETARQYLARLSDQPDLPLPEVFRRVSEAASETLRVERAGIWLFVNGDKVLRCVNLFERSRRKHTKGACLSLADCPAFLRTIGTTSLLPCEKARTDPRVSELASAYFAPLGIASVLYAPLLREGRVVGLLCYEHVGSPRDWSDPDRSIALKIADFVVGRMKTAEGSLRTTPRAHFVIVPPAVPAPTQLAHDLKDLLVEIEVLARSSGVAGAAERFHRIADAAARGVVIVHKLFDSQDETGEHDTLPDEDTGEHQALPKASG